MRNPVPRIAHPQQRLKRSRIVFIVKRKIPLKKVGKRVAVGNETEHRGEVETLLPHRDSEELRAVHRAKSIVPQWQNCKRNL